jgi:hypothetical protein
VCHAITGNLHGIVASDANDMHSIANDASLHLFLSANKDKLITTAANPDVSESGLPMVNLLNPTLNRHRLADGRQAHGGQK